MISYLVLDNVCIYCIITFYCLLPSFHKFIIQIYVNFLILLIYQANTLPVPELRPGMICLLM